MSGLHPPVGPDDHVSGPDDAPVTLVEYGDFECPSCGAAYPVVERVRARMGDRLRYVFRNFPLSEMHPHAEHAAEAAEAAGVEGKFWEMYRMLFEHQERLDDRSLARYAEAIGLDGTRLARELDAGAFAETVRQQFMSGVRSGVNGTPTFFINGERWDGAWNDEEALAGALGGRGSRV